MPVTALTSGNRDPDFKMNSKLLKFSREFNESVIPYGAFMDTEGTLCFSH